MMGVTVRLAATDEDLLGKAFVHWRGWSEAYEGIVSQGFLDARTLEYCEGCARRARDLGISTLLALDGERVVGFCDYGPYRGDFVPAPRGADGAGAQLDAGVVVSSRDADGAGASHRIGEVYAIYVLRSHYGRGVGHALMTEALDALVGFDSVAVWVLRENARAIRFYERHGFVADGAEQMLDLGGPVQDMRMMLVRQAGRAALTIGG